MKKAISLVLVLTMSLCSFGVTSCFATSSGPDQISTQVQTEGSEQNTLTKEQIESTSKEVKKSTFTQKLSNIYPAKLEMRLLE